MPNLRSISEILVERAIVHILDLSHDEPILNDFMLDLDENISSFLTSHILRSLRDEVAKTADFSVGSNIVREASDAILSTDEADELFVRASKDIASHLYKSMRAVEGAPSCDLVVCTFNSEGHRFLAILKLDYMCTYIHNTEFADGRFKIGIIPQMVGLPGVGQRLRKCAFIGQASVQPRLLVVDKQSSGNGAEDDGYWSSLFLRVATVVDSTEKTRRLKAATESWTRKELKEDVEKAEEVRATVVKALRTQENLNVEDLSKDLLKGEPQLRESFVAHLSSQDLVGDVPVDTRWVEQHVKKVKLKTDCGIEISVPADLYEDGTKFRIRKNGNGTIDIVILGIRQYKQS